MSNYTHYRHLNYGDVPDRTKVRSNREYTHQEYSYNQRPGSQSKNISYRPNLYFQDSHGKRPSTPVYLLEQGKEEIYNMQLKHSINTRLNQQNKVLPKFPLMDEQSSLASDALGNIRPVSAGNPEFMLPKDVQFYFRNREKVNSRFDEFCKSEKKNITEMIDECLRTIITLFEEHKTGLFNVLVKDKETFSKIYLRFNEGVDSFLKGAEDRLEHNLKAYQERILKIHEDEENPLTTHIEKLKIEKEMIQSKEKIIQEIKKSYEDSSIPIDKEKISELMVDQFKKKHSCNISSLAQHMQNMIGDMRKSIEMFKDYQNYISFDLKKDVEPEQPQISTHDKVLFYIS
jgi:hypothetical protein